MLSATWTISVIARVAWANQRDNKGLAAQDGIKRSHQRARGIGAAVASFDIPDARRRRLGRHSGWRYRQGSRPSRLVSLLSSQRHDARRCDQTAQREPFPHLFGKFRPDEWRGPVSEPGLLPAGARRAICRRQLWERG